MIDRLIGVFRLNAQTFQDIVLDKNATGQAALLVLLVALVTGVGGGIASLLFGRGQFLQVFLWLTLSLITGWLLWSVLLYLIGTAIFGSQAGLAETLRVIGFATTPYLLSIVPCLGFVVGWLWSLAAGFVAVRQGLDLDNTKAFLTIVVGFIAYVALAIVVGGVTAGIGAVLGG